MADNFTLTSPVEGQYTPTGKGHVTLVGSHFHDPLLVAPIVINGVCAAVFIAFTVHQWVRRFESEESRKAFVAMLSLLGGMTLSVTFPLAFSFSPPLFVFPTCPPDLPLGKKVPAIQEKRSR